MRACVCLRSFPGCVPFLARKCWTGRFWPFLDVWELQQIRLLWRSCCTPGLFVVVRGTSGYRSPSWHWWERTLCCIVMCNFSWMCQVCRVPGELGMRRTYLVIVTPQVCSVCALQVLCAYFSIRNLVVVMPFINSKQWQKAGHLRQSSEVVFGTVTAQTRGIQVLHLDSSKSVYLR